MSDVPFCSSENACTEGGEQTNGCEPVCINVSRIYDSCGAKDCLSNLPVMFTEANQKIIDGACSVKISNVRIITSTVEVEPVAFHRGFYSVDMMYYFAVTVEAYMEAALAYFSLPVRSYRVNKFLPSLILSRLSSSLW